MSGWNSLNDGLKLGLNIGQRWIDNDRQKAQDARDQADFQARQDEQAYQKSQRVGVDNAIAAQQGLQANGVYTGGNTSGLSEGSARMLYESGGQKAVDDTASYANVENRRFGLDAGYKTSMPAEAGGAATPTVQGRAASQLEIERGFGNIAAAQKNVAGMQASQQNQTRLKYDEGYTTYRKTWDTMDDAAKGDLIKKLSDDTGVKGYGTWTPGKGKTAGYMTYLPPSGDPIKLSNKEAGELYALTNLMEVDPARARAEMSKASDKVEALAMHAFEAQTKGVTANNTAAHYAEQGEIGRSNAGSTRMNAETNRDYKNQMVDISRDKAAAAGGKGADALWAKAEEVAGQGYYGGNVERAYSGLKRGQDRGGVQEQADKLEFELRKGGNPEDVVRQQLDGFRLGKGLPPEKAIAALRSGVGPDGKPLSQDALRAWDAKYPAMPSEDVLGGSAAPTAAQMDIINQDMEANGITDAGFSWSTPSGVGVKGRMGSGLTTPGSGSKLPPPMPAKAHVQRGGAPSQDTTPRRGYAPGRREPEQETLSPARTSAPSGRTYR